MQKVSRGMFEDPLHSKNVFLFVVTYLRCLTFAIQIDACAEFVTTRLLSDSSAEVGRLLCALLKSNKFVTSYLM